MNKPLRICFLAILFSFLAFSSLPAVDFVLNKTPAQVYFSPNGGGTEAIVKEIDGAKTEVLVQAYSFTSVPIAKALLNAHLQELNGCASDSNGDILIIEKVARRTT